MDAYIYVEHVRRLFACGVCGWWVFHGYEDENCHGGDGATRYYHTTEKIVCGMAQRYDITKSSLPLDLLRQWLAKHPKHLALVNPHAFEKVMADCFKDVYPDAEVIHVGKCSGDGGIDIKLVTTRKETILVQVKRREDLTSTEGVDAIRSLNGVLMHQNKARGIVVSTAKTFSPAAKREALPVRPRSTRYKVDLLAFDDVVSMLRVGNRANQSAWHAASEQFYVDGHYHVQQVKDRVAEAIPAEICDLVMRKW